MNRVASFLSEVDARVKLSSLKRGIYDYYRGQNTGQVTASSNLMRREPSISISSPEKPQDEVLAPDPVPDPVPAPVPVKEEEEFVVVETTQEKLVNIAKRLVADPKGKNKELKPLELRNVLMDYTGLPADAIPKSKNNDIGSVTKDSNEIKFRGEPVSLLPDPANADSVLVQVGNRQYPATNGLMLLLLAHKDVKRDEFEKLWQKSGITEADKQAYVQICFDTVDTLGKSQKTPTGTALARNFEFLGDYYKQRNAVYKREEVLPQSPKGKGKRKPPPIIKISYFDPLGNAIDMRLIKDDGIDFTAEVGAGIFRGKNKKGAATHFVDVSDERYIRNRIHLLLASRMAGNDSPQLAQEVKELIQKLKAQ